MDDAWLRELEGYRLLDLVTFRRDGAPVSTPVRFAVDGDHLVVSLRTDSGKVKRARATPTVRVSGHPDGVASEAILRFVEGAEARQAEAALRRRYRLLFLQRLVLGRRPNRHATAVIRR